MRQVQALILPPGADGPEPDGHQAADAQAPGDPGGGNADGVQQPVQAAAAGAAQQHRHGRIGWQGPEQGQHASAVQLQEIDPAHDQVEQPVAHGAFGWEFGEGGLIG